MIFQIKIKEDKYACINDSTRVIETACMGLDEKCFFNFNFNFFYYLK